MRHLKLVPAETKFGFMGLRRAMVGLSLALAVGTLITLLLQGLNLGIDFRGGVVIVAETEQATDAGVYRSVLGDAGFSEAAITDIADPAEALTGDERHQTMIRLPLADGAQAAQTDQISQARQALEAALPGVKFLSVDSVGGKVSGELLQTGLIALGLAVAAILIYIWLRFEWQFAAAAVLSLLHDVVLTFGVFSIAQVEFNLPVIAALLTIIGYSLNDTVIVFDRIRENLRRYKTLPLDQLLDLSINETLSRTVMTSVTTLLALGALVIFGGEVLRPFTAAMIWGVLVGTYSSIFIASPILLWLGLDRGSNESPKAGGVQFGAADAP